MICLDMDDSREQEDRFVDRVLLPSLLDWRELDVVLIALLRDSRFRGYL